MNNVINPEIAVLLKENNFKEPVFYAYIKNDKYVKELMGEDYTIEFDAYHMFEYNIDYVKENIKFNMFYYTPLVNYNFTKEEIDDYQLRNIGGVWCFNWEWEELTYEESLEKYGEDVLPDFYHECFSAPTYEEVFNWLLEKHNLHIKIDFLYTLPLKWYYDVKSADLKFVYTSFDDKGNNEICDDINAVKSAAIIKCLEIMNNG